MSNNWRLYTLEHVFISETFTIPDNFTGMARTIQYLLPTQRWYKNGLKHRCGGPAIEYANGRKCWFVNDKRHRLDGPAIEHCGYKEWYIDDKQVTEEQHDLLVDVMKLKGLI